MGLLETFLGKDNAAAQWAGQNQNLLGALSAGLAQGPDFGQGVANALSYAPKARMLDIQAADKLKEKAKEEQATNYTRDWLKKNRPDLLPGLEMGISPSDLAVRALTKDENPYMSAGDGQFFNWQTGEYTSNPNASADGGGETGFTPVWGTIDGKQTVALPGNDGNFYIDGKPIDTTKFIPTNPYDLNAQKAGGRAFGTATGGTQFSVPSAQLELKQSVDAIGNLQADDVKAGMEDWFKQWGALPRGAWVQGGSNMAKFQIAANNIIDRSWLSARAMLKGAGQVTDYEGTKAENAVSMMKTALEKGDKASYEDAVKDYEYWINQGFAKIQQQAGAMDGYGSAGGAGSGNAGDGWTVIGVE